MIKSGTPLSLWDFCCQYTVELRNSIARPLPQLHGRTPYEVLTGNTPDISEFLEFRLLFQYVWYYEPSVFPEQNRNIARWTGIAHQVGQAMCFWIPPISGTPIARTTIQTITQEELGTDEVKALIFIYDKATNEKLGHTVEGLSEESNIAFNLYREDEYEDDDMAGQDPIEPDAVAPIIDVIAHDAYDELFHVEPVFHRDGQMLRARIIGRKRDANGNPVGQYNINPILNSCIYLAEFPDGHIQELSANTIIEAVYNQIDGDGFDEQFFHDIIDHCYDSTVMSPSELEHIQHLRQNQGQGKCFCTLKGWEVVISWKDGTTSWHPMSDIKNLFPLLLAKYAVTNDLTNEPAFAWWAPYTIKKEKQLIKATKSRYSQRSHKFGIYVPKTVEEALEIDKKTSTTYWRDAIHKKMSNNRLAFQFLTDDEAVPVGYKWIQCHMIFDVKMDFTRKA